MFVTAEGYYFFSKSLMNIRTKKMLSTFCGEHFFLILRSLRFFKVVEMSN